MITITIKIAGDEIAYEADGDPDASEFERRIAAVTLAALDTLQESMMVGGDHLHQIVAAVVRPHIEQRMTEAGFVKEQCND